MVVALMSESVLGDAAMIVVDSVDEEFARPMEFAY